MIDYDVAKCKIIDKLISDIDTIEVPLYKVLFWDKKFKGIPKEWQPKTFKVNHISAEEMKKISNNQGEIKLLSTGLFDGYVDEYDSNFINELEVITLPTGGSANIKYYNGKFIDSGNLLAQTMNSDQYNLKYIYYCLFGMKKYINDFCYRGSSIKHPEMSKILEIKIRIPDKQSQAKIVSKLDDVFNLLDRKEKNDMVNNGFKVLLKSKILDSAIRGTLVNNDESLKPLDVARIDSNIPYEIPSNWIWGFLKDISDYGSNKKKNGKDIKDDEWLLELEDIEKDTGRIIKKVMQKERKAVSDKNIFKENDVLYGKLRPYLNKCVIAHESGYCSTEIEPITLIDCVLPEYLHIVMTSKYFLNYVNSCSYGAKMPRLGTKDGQNAMIPLPPFEEQKRIVKKVDSLFELIKQL